MSQQVAPEWKIYHLSNDQVLAVESNGVKYEYSEKWGHQFSGSNSRVLLMEVFAKISII